MSSAVVGHPDGQGLDVEGGGDSHEKKLAFLRSLSSATGSIKPAGGPNKLSILFSPRAADTASTSGKHSNGSAMRPRSVGLSRAKSKAMYYSTHRSHRSMEAVESVPELEKIPIVFPEATLPDGVAAPDSIVKMFVLPNNRGALADGATTSRSRRSSSAAAAAASLSSSQPQPGAVADDSDDDPESATTPIQLWSPVPTERSTPPADQGSIDNAHQQNRPASAPDSPSGGAGGGGDGSGATLSRMMTFFRRRTRSVPIAPNAESPVASRKASVILDSDAGSAFDVDRADDEAAAAAQAIFPPSPPTPLSTASVEPSRAAAVLPVATAAVVPSPWRELRGDGDTSSILSSSSSLGGRTRTRAPLAGARDLIPLTPPSDYGAGFAGEDVSDSSDEETAENPSSARAARNRGTASEGDIEEGGSHAAAMGSVAFIGRGARTREEMKSEEPETRAAVAAPSVAVAPARTSGKAEAAVIENGIVMPCAPSEHEKVYYYKTGRAFLVTFGTLSFLAATVGMWLFTIASPYFFWFGAPTMFLMMYLVFHYFIVAIWGKDFSPEEHAEIVRSAEEAGHPPPTVDVFLPVCREDIALLRNTWKYVSALDYPSFEVYVLDDGAKDDVRELADSFGFHYIRRDNRPEMKKAGNLRYAFARSSGDAVAIFDADFCPRADFLKETTPYLQDPSIGIVQTPQYFRYRKEQTWVEQGAGSSQEFFYRLVQMNQDRFHGAVCVGSCGLYRRSAVAPFGGVVSISHSEDMYTGYKMTELGHKIKYLPLCLAMGTCPDEPRSFFMQQYRWCMGSASLLSEKGFWKANLSTLHKICFFNGLLYYISTAMILILTPLPIILLIYIKADSVLWYYSGFALPSIFMSCVVMPIWSKQPYGLSVHRVRVIQSYAHLSALLDNAMGRAAAWVPSGGGASKSPSRAYTTSVAVMLLWTMTSTILIVGGSLWRMMEFPWYHYAPAIALAMGNFLLSISSLS